MTTHRVIVLVLTLGLVIAAGSAAIPGNAQTVVSTSRFVLQIGGRTVGVFSQASGINTEVDIYSAPSGKIPHTEQFGKTKPPSITLRRSLSATNALRAWHQQARAGSPAGRKNATLLLENKAGQVMMSYKLLNAWPSKISAGGMKAGPSATAIETITLRYEEIVREQGPGRPLRRR